MTKEVIVALFKSVALRLSPSTTTNMNKMAESPTSHEAKEMQISFMGAFPGQTDPRNHTNRH